MIGKIKLAFAKFNKKGEFKIEEFKELVEALKNCPTGEKVSRIDQLMSYDPLIKHYSKKGLKVLSASSDMEWEHELHTSKKLVKEGYHVLFIPKGYFKRDGKRFDVFLFKDHVFIEAELKCFDTKNSNTIAERIKKAQDQAKRLVIDVHSKISKNDLIDALRSGCEKNDSLIEIMLFYNGRFYRLPKTHILTKNKTNNIYTTLK